MLQLNDASIRKSLILKLKSQAVRPKAVIEELRVHNGNAIADVVALYSEAHCFEIKGDGDKIERILEQGKYYNLSFRKITVVTTLKHLKKALSIAPDYWGIMIAEEINNNIRIKYIRAGKNNPNFNKSIALLTLWKDEMLELIESKKQNRNSSRTVLAELIANNKRKLELSQNIAISLFDRYSVNKYSRVAYK